MKRLVILLSLVAASATFAAPRHVSIPLGETRALTVPEEVATVEVTNPDVLEVKTSAGGKVTLEPRTTGKTKIHLRTESDAHVELLVFVTSGGSVELLQPR